MQACFAIFVCFKMLSIGAFFGFLNFDWSLSASLSVEFRTHIACSRTVHCNIIDGSLFFFCISLLLFPPHPSKRKKKSVLSNNTLFLDILFLSWFPCDNRLYVVIPVGLQGLTEISLFVTSAMKAQSTRIYFNLSHILIFFFSNYLHIYIVFLSCFLR